MKKLSLLIVAFALVAACTPSTPIVPGKTDKQKVQDYNTVKGSAKDPTHGDSVGFWYGAIAGVSGQKANGVAYMNTFADGVSRITVNLNIAERADGKHLVAYVQGSDSSSAVKVGELQSIIGDARHSVTLETKEDIKKLLTVNVYLTESIDAEEGIFVATGTMKASK